MSIKPTPAPGQIDLPDSLYIETLRREGIDPVPAGLLEIFKRIHLNTLTTGMVLRAQADFQRQELAELYAAKSKARRLP